MQLHQCEFVTLCLRDVCCVAGTDEDRDELAREFEALSQVCGLWFVVCGLWVVGCGLWFVVCGLWFVVCGLWFVVCGLWFMVFDL